MKLTIFAKKRTTEDGKKSFYTYFTKLNKKDGTEITSSVKFREDCGQPDGKACPMNIVVDKSDANFNEKGITYEDKDGNVQDAIERVLWISDWKEGEPYVDTSLDEFDFN